MDEKTREAIYNALTHYEQESWARFLEMERDIKRKIFSQFAATPDSTELSIKEYHRTMTKWYKFAKWCAPGDLRYGDSISALQGIVARDKKLQGGGSATAGGGDIGALNSLDVKMTYRTWLDILDGKHRPEEYSTSAHSK